MPTTLITADNLFAIKLEPGLEEILDTGDSDKSDKNEKSDIGEPGECLEVGGDEEIEGEEEEGFSFYDANAPKVTNALCSYPLKLGRSKILKSKSPVFAQFCSKFKNFSFDW